MTMTKCKYIDDYINAIESGSIRASKEIKQACEYIRRKLDNPDVFIDAEKTEKAIQLIEKYFEIKLFPWESFVIGLIHCYYKSNDTVVFSEFLIMMGRGNGKNGFISSVVWYLTTKYHGVKEYNVDIIANNEEQAKTSFEDVYNMLDRTWVKSKRFFYKTKEIIRNLNTQSYIKFNTSNAKTKDGKRSACLVFDEIHEYQNNDAIKVFRSGFGKRKHSRIFYITTNGYVREGVLDERLRIAHDVLNGDITESRLCPLIYKLDSESEAEDKRNWEKANPSLPYLPTLQLEMEQNWIDKDYDQSVKLDLYTKRFNLPKNGQEIAVTEYKNISATNQPLPDLRRRACVVGIDYAELSDWAAVNLHFRDGNTRYDINHAWICRDSQSLPRVKAPWRDWVDRGLCTYVDDVSIPPALLAEYIAEQGQQYMIRGLAMDNYRWSVMSDTLREIGFDASDKKRVKIVRPSDIMKTEPVIQECFARGYFIWGDNPCLRWATNNTKRVRSGKRDGTDTGNYYYAKIEGKSRKTDPFMALVASMTFESLLGSGSLALPSIGAIRI